MEITNLDDEQLKALQRAMTPKLNKFIQGIPTPKQSAALLMNSVREMLFG